MACKTRALYGLLEVADRFFAIVSILPVAALLPLPERAKRAVLAFREVLALLVRAAHVALAHRHLLDAVMEEELLYLLLHLRVRRYVGSDPALQDRLGIV